MEQTISITDKARNELSSLMENEQDFLRLTIVPGGCSGMTYQAIIDDTQTGLDKLLYEQEGVRVYADRASLPYLEGLAIDYSDDLIQQGFRFSNVRAVRSCGCGSSFEMDNAV